MKTPWLPVLLLVALPGTALAEAIPFTTLGRGWFGPPGEPRQLVFHEEHELVTTVLAHQLDPDPEEQLDWSTHQVIAVLMGTRGSGGYATTIESLELDPSGELIVRYTETTPRGPAASFMTAPFHMILCPRTHGAVRFVRAETETAEETITGRVQVDGDEVQLVTASNAFVVQSATRARELARFPGREVRVVGQVRSDWGTAVLEVSRIISPERRPISGIAQAQDGRASLLVDGSSTPVRVSGPAQSAVQAAVGALVDCDAFVFTSPDERPLEASVESVKAAAILGSTLRSSASLLGDGDGSVTAGEDVAVLRTFGPVARVRNADGDEGWVHVNRLRLGTPLVAPPSETPGLIGAFQTE